MGWDQRFSHCRSSCASEIYFLVHPECIAARLFVESIGDNEVIVISGVERYCAYTGYGSEFAFTVSLFDCFEGSLSRDSPHMNREILLTRAL